MTKRRRIAALALVATLVLAGMTAFVIHVMRARGLGIPAELVPPNWEQYRTSAGHRVHVSQEGLACKECHDYEHGGFKSPGAGICAKCHEKENTKSHLGDEALKTNCLTCHAFSPKEPATCISCHAESHGPSAAITVHADVACTNCHQPHHDPSIAPKDCTTCHEQVTPEHANHAESKGCLDCHTGHAEAAAAKSQCATCHTTPAGPRPANHDSCLSCHKPHEFIAGGEKACIGCHGTKPTLAANVVTAHAECLSCHVPHNPTQAATSCPTCHTTIHTGHPAVANKTVCTTCHTPHSGDPNKIVSSCTSCHTKIALADTTVHAGGTVCTSCHAPHEFRKPVIGAPFCSTCHAREATLAATNVGHQDCARCHGNDAHRIAVAPSCGTCHAKEQATAPLGHQKCTQCHEAHSGARAIQTTCASCHVKEAQDKHAIDVGNCQTCHRPHGPGGIASPPTCRNCHTQSKLAGVHANVGHTTCTNCHTPHVPPRADRATCTSNCHTDKKAHEPQATACNGCHVFR